jgi:arginine decarboxylase
MSHVRASAVMKTWSIQDTLDLYNISAWGGGMFGISAEGHLTVMPEGAGGPSFSLKTLSDDLRDRGIQLPILVRCTDLLRARVEELHRCFLGAIKEYGYQGTYRGVYPIKVNQQRHVVEEILRFGQPYHYGLEAGSKPELLAVIAILDDPEALILCNGHKDEEYVEIALLASRLGKKVILVIEKLSELPIVLRVAQRLGVRPRLGFRAKLSARGAGRWQESSGDLSKFGLTASEMLHALQMLREADAIACLELVHFHLGSQITDIRQIKVALREACRYYVELKAEGAPMGYLDVGGGLGVDYDGSRTNFKASINYTMQEYANDVVSAIQEMCDHAGVAHPVIVSESGRAITAHHSILLFEVVSVSRMDDGDAPPPVPDHAPAVIKGLAETYHATSRKNFQEAFHDVMQARDEVATLFNHGIVGLQMRALAERYAWATFRKIQPHVRELEYVADELQGLERIMADTYYCNFSTFQSMPDSWAIGQLFPIVPVQRLNEEPRRRAVLADITCDSDGKIDKFIDLRDVKDILELHEPKTGEDYLLGAFLVGAYQEILGDLHNLFGDINAVHVQVTPDGGYVLDHVVQGDSVSEVLRYVEFGPEVLLERMRRAVEAAVRRGELSFKESKQLIELYKTGLDGYTYLES